MRKLVVATRRSELALSQCRWFIDKFKSHHPGLEVEELHVVTTGDRIQDRPLSEIGGKALFLKEIEEALLDGTADFAVHSMKDVPPELHPELCLACVPEREDPRDVLVTRERNRLSELAEGSRLGTSSLRRMVQLKELRPDLEVQSIRGNVGTRIRKCREGVVDVTVLAAAGLNRLGLTAEGDQVLSVEESLPAVGQGALAVEIRREDTEIAELLAPLQDEETAVRAAAERGVMAAVEGDCKTPVASYAERVGAEIWLRALLADSDGTRLRRDEVRAPWPETLAAADELGRELGHRLRDAAS